MRLPAAAGEDQTSSLGEVKPWRRRFSSNTKVRTTRFAPDRTRGSAQLSELEWNVTSSPSQSGLRWFSAADQSLPSK